MEKLKLFRGSMRAASVAAHTRYFMLIDVDSAIASCAAPHPTVRCEVLGQQPARPDFAIATTRRDSFASP
jgi:hypothetical protein